MLKRPSQNRRRGHLSARQAMVATLIVVAVLLASPSLPLAIGKGKPGGGGDPPPVALPNWRYEVTWLEGEDGWNFRPEGMNDLGDVVGQAHSLHFAAAYLPSFFGAGSPLIDLNGLGASWYEAADLGNPVDGWHAYSSTAINNNSEIVGIAENADGALRSFVFRDAFGGSPQFILLPDVGEADLDTRYATRINNDGVVVARASWGTAKYDPTNNYALEPLLVNGGQLTSGNFFRTFRFCSPRFALRFRM